MVALTDMMHAAGLKCLLLDIPFAFHSSQLDPILDDFERAARRVIFKAPVIPIISPLLGQWVSDGKVIIEMYLRRATREPVNFVAALDAAMAAGKVDDKTAWIYIGPHPVCTSFIRNHYGAGVTKTFASLRQGDDILSTLIGSLATLHCLGLPVAWNEYVAPHEKEHRLLHLNSYHWNQKNYWIQYEGTWTLDKAHARVERKNDASPGAPASFTSSVQYIISEEITESVGRITALSNLAHPDLRGAADGHKINGRSVVTGSIWADVALTIGEYLYSRMVPNAGKPFMDVRDMEVTDAQIVREEGTDAPSTAQFIQAEGVIDFTKKQTDIRLYSAGVDGSRNSDKPFATATVCYEDVKTWQAEWQTASHLVEARADSLWKMSSQNSTVSRLSQSVVYQLFGNVVDHSTRYRGMQCVALAPDIQEATADIVLDVDRHGTWHTPPHWIDSSFQLAGFVMNAFGVQGEGDTARSARDFFYITPGWRHFWLAELLESGSDRAYRNYVRMFAVDGEPGAFAGDMYLLRGDKVVCICAGIKFKQVPRTLMPLMFPRRDGGKSRNRDMLGSNTTSSSSSSVAYARPSPPPAAATTYSNHTKLNHILSPTITLSQRQDQSGAVHTTAPVPMPVPAPPLQPAETTLQQAEGEKPSQVDACVRLIASETGLDLEDLSGQAPFAEMGVDSLMSLVLSEKIHAELGIEIKASIFLECATIQEFTDWLTK